MKSGSMNENLSADDPAYTYPLVLTIRDDYDPCAAACVIEIAQQASIETLTKLMSVEVEIAYIKCKLNRN
jgi:hypothetical protein